MVLNLDFSAYSRMPRTGTVIRAIIAQHSTQHSVRREGGKTSILIPDIGRLAANWRDEEIPGLTRPILGVGVVADVWKGVRKDWGVEAVLSRRY